MILQLIRAAVLLSASVVVHALGTVAIVRPVRRHYLGPDRRALHRPVALGRKNSLFAGSNGGLSSLERQRL